MSRQEYEAMVHDRLLLDLDFLEKNRNSIRSRFLEAADLMSRREADMVPDDVSAINQCIHIASTVVLLGSNTIDINETIQYVKDNESYKDVDPTTVISAVALYYLLTVHEQDALSDEERKKLGRIKDRFTQINWMLTPRAVAALGMAPIH